MDHLEKALREVSVDGQAKGNAMAESASTSQTLEGNKRFLEAESVSEQLTVIIPSLPSSPQLSAARSQLVSNACVLSRIVGET